MFHQLITSCRISLQLITSSFSLIPLHTLSRPPHHHDNIRQHTTTHNMAPTVILIRHAQAQHNLTKDYQIPDPPLTDAGLEQCSLLRESLRSRFSHIAPEDAAIIASPMDRTLQTTQLGLDWLIEKGVRVLADPDWQGK